LRHTITRYKDFISWLVPDSLWRRKWAVATILTAGSLGIAFQVKVFGLIVYYARHFSSGEMIRFGGKVFDPRSSIGLLGIGSLAVTSLLLLSALCIFFSRRNILRMGREYEEFCGKRVFYLLGKKMDLFSSAENSAGAYSYLFRLIKADSRLAGRLLRMLLSLIVPFLTLTAAIVVLVYLEPVLTLLIAGFSIIFLYYQYRISRKAAGDSMRFETLVPAAGQEYRGLLSHFRHQSLPDENRDMVDQLFIEGPVKKQLDAYEGRLRGVENSRLVSGVFMAGILGLISLVMGVGIIREGDGWEKLLIYLVALRFAMTNLQTTFSLITSINRFYPQVRRYFLFVRSVEGQSVGKYSDIARYQLRVEEKKDAYSIKDFAVTGEVKPGSRLSLISSMKLNRYTMASLFKALLGEDQAAYQGALYTSRFAITGQSCPGMPLAKALGVSSKTGWQEMRAWFPDEKMFALAKEKLPGNLDKPIKPKVWEKLDAKLKFILGMFSAGQSDCQWILLEAGGLDLLGPEQAGFYLDRFRDKIAVVVFDKNLGQVGSFAEDLVAVVLEEHLAGLGSVQWFEAARPSIETLLFKPDGKEQKAGMFLEDDELDEM
jgi:hypothetical protein